MPLPLFHLVMLNPARTHGHRSIICPLVRAEVWKDDPEWHVYHLYLLWFDLRFKPRVLFNRKDDNLCYFFTVDFDLCRLF